MVSWAPQVATVLLVVAVAIPGWTQGKEPSPEPEAPVADSKPPAEKETPPVAPAPESAPAPEPQEPATAGSDPKETPSAPATDVPGPEAKKAPPKRNDYNVRLRSIEERVNALKEKIFQSKARLLQLQEVVLHGTISGAKVVILHRNEMGSSFRLTRVQYSLDGAVIYNRVDSGDGQLNDQEELAIFSGGLAPGEHQLAIYLEYQGHGYGIFSYLKDYKFKIRDSYTFGAEEGRVTTVHAVGFEKGGITTELKDRPAIRFEVQVSQDLRDKGTKDGAKP